MRIRSLLNISRDNGRFPYVCLNNPFVCDAGHHIIPLVYKKIPLVKKHGGFTLIELMITLVIVGILAGLAVPAVTTLIANQRLSSQINDLISDFNFARSEAIKRSTYITICKTADPNTATPACNVTASASWTAGRLVFIDIDFDGVVDAGDEILRIRQVLEGTTPAGNSLWGNGVDPAGTANRITFTGTGASINLTAESQLTLCDKRGDSFGRAIAINALGRARSIDRGKNIDNSAITVCP